MTDFDIRLLGTVQALRMGQPVKGFRAYKVLGVLGYLAAQDRPVMRGSLAMIFWPELDEPKALAELRRALNNLGALLPGCIEADRLSVWVAPAARPRIDLFAFDELAGRSDVAAWEQAAALCRGEFMAGFYLDECADFETWLLAERERWRQKASALLGRLTARHEQQRRHDRALVYARQQLDIDPWREETHRQVMLLLARSGQRSAALAQYETCRRILADELNAAPGPKTIALAERIRALPETPVFDDPTADASAPFVGRATELAALLERLDDPACRLVTLVGPGGVGKTRLAVEAALERSHGDFLDGVCFVPLAPLASPDELVTTIAGAMSFTFAGVHSPQAQLLDYLAGREMLLVLDNMEHLLPRGRPDPAGGNVVEFLRHLLRRAPLVKVLATSRERLNLSQEWVFDLGGLNAEDGLALFARCAMRLRAGALLSEEDLSTARRICARLDGLPLAIELAAGWLRALSVPDIAGEIERDPDFLSSTERGPSDRHRSMRAVFDRSWAMLNAREAEAFCRLSVFSGGFSADAARAVAGTAFDTLRALHDKSFLRHAGHDRAGHDRFDMHDVLRQHGAEKLPAATAEAVRAAHGAYYAGWLRDWHADLKGARVVETIALMQADLDNIRAAWSHAVDTLDLAQLARMVDGLHVFYDARGLFEEGLAVFGHLTQRLRDTPAAGPADCRADLLSGLLTAQAWFCWQVSRFEAGLTLAREAVDIAVAAEQPGRQAQALFALASLEASSQRHGEAFQHYAESRALASAQGDAWCEALALRALGLFAHALGQNDQAELWLEEALAVCERSHDRRNHAYALQSLGMVRASQGRYQDARRMCADSLPLFEQLRDWKSVAAVLDSQHRVEAALGCYVEAEALALRSLQLRRQEGNRLGEGMALSGLALLALWQGRAPQATHYSQAALEIGRELDEPRVLCAALLARSEETLAQGDWAGAAWWAQDAVTLCRQRGHRVGLMNAWRALGRALLCQGRACEAGIALADALDMARQADNPRWMLEAMAEAAHWLAGQGRPELAAQLAQCVAYAPAAPAISKQRVAPLIGARAGNAARGDAAGECESGDALTALAARAIDLLRAS